ncbi:MAG TPA: 4-carboxymuconolactone decarboxylase [Advenella kashmirensis]|uniref:4-carboxymuconolactone decarboxylase n=1 Tax=Advenella kashmirensis TaxID=310575 RepID=A0A356LEP4_9BURK|nr:4-carboxymuconolactone decarboxylase [Advenella kashmirensis]
MSDIEKFKPVTNDIVELGHRNRRQTLGDDYVDASIKRAEEDDFMQPLQDAVTGLAWGAVWGRPGLSLKHRSMVTMSVLIALGRPNELALHINGALNNGWTKEELQEILLQAACYCGMPAAVDGFRVAKEVLNQRARKEDQ